MKKKVLALALILTMALTVGLVACNSGSNAAGSQYQTPYETLVSSLIGKNKAGTYTAYGPVHNVYLGKADITIDNKGKITALVLDEYFLPHQYARVTTVGTVAVTEVATNAVSGKANQANKFTLGGRTFELVTTITDNDAYDASVPTLITPTVTVATNAATTYATKYWVYKQTAGDPIPGTVANETATLYTNDLTKLILGNQEAAAWYVNAIGDGTGLVLLNAGGTSAGVTAKDYASGVHKLEHKYWGSVSGSQVYTWQGNMNLIQDFAVAQQLPDITGATGSLIRQVAGVWVYGSTISTGATATDFANYYNLAQAAYIKALQAK
jgi:hypothetical protein